MQFYMPVRVFDEADCVAKHAAYLASFGKKALIVTGKSSAVKCGALNDVEDALKETGTEWCVFSEVEENPSVETVVRAAHFAREEGADFVIGIGGGSPLDAAKAIAFLLKREIICAADLYNASADPSALDVIAIPTTCGTGSEVTGVSVLTVHEKKTKSSIPHRIFPKAALIDGKYLHSAPRSILVNTAVDALAHMIESYESIKSDDYSRAAVRQGMRLWAQSADILNGSRKASDEDYARMMRASAFAGIAIAQTGTSIPHALSYILTYDLKMPHGMACGYFLSRFLKEADNEDREELLSLAGFESMEQFEAYMQEVFPDVTVPAETLQRAYDAVVKNTARLKGCRFAPDAEGLKRIAGL